MAEQNNIFTKPWKPINKFKFALMNIGEALLKIILWLVDFVLSMFVSVFQFLKTVAIGIYKGICVVGNFFKRKGHQFKYNNKEGKISFFIWGYSNFKNHQIVNGLMYIIFEIGYIVLFAIYGAKSIANLSLTNQKATWIDPECPTCDPILGDNSVMVLIYGLLWLISLIIFFYIWNRSINAGYTNYRIKEFTRFSRTYDAYKESAKLIDEESQKMAKDGVSRKQYKEYVNDVLVQMVDTKTSKNQQDYAMYLFQGVINSSYDFCARLAKAQVKVDKATKKLEDYKKKFEVKHEELEKEKQALSKSNVQVDFATASAEEIDASIDSKIAQDNTASKFMVKYDKYHNKATMKIADLEQKLKNTQHKYNEVIKTYANFVEVQSKRNNDKYGKFNVYYKTIAEFDKELLFYNHYQEFLDIYNNSFGNSGDANEQNREKLAELKAQFDEKNARTAEKFAGIRNKRVELEAQLADIKAAYNVNVKSIQASNDSNKETLLANAKDELVKDSTRIMNAINDLPSAKMVKGMEKEEYAESKHSYNRDRKYLRTNYTDEGYAKQQVIDRMLVEYKLEFKDANYFTNLLLNKETGMMSPDLVEEKIKSIEMEKSYYIDMHQDKFVGKPHSFKEQVKALFNEKFHITILALPLLGIVCMTILPLIFSILIAFTNYSKGHIPPTQLFYWVGLENFFNVFSPAPDSIYALLPQALGQTLSWTLIWAVCATFSNYILGIVVALMINKESIKLKKLWRTIFVMTIAIPQFISLLTIFNLLKEGGLVDTLVLQMTGSKLGFATNKAVGLTKLIIILVNIWVGIPYTILSTTGILLNIPKDLYESSTVDGAGTFKQFTKITMPYILFVTGPYLITQFVGNINNFNVIYFLTGGNPKLVGSALNVGQTDLLITFLYKLITDGSNPQYGIASTLGILIFVICAFFSIVMYNKSGSIKEEDQFQ